jgi:rod shape-determining protein MreC
LNRDNSVSAKLKKTGEAGYVTWDGKDPQTVIVKDIPKSAQVNKGDTILTTGLTPQYPGGIMIGTVMKVEQEKSSTAYILSVKPSTNFYTLEYVYVLNNLQAEELKQLEDKMKKDK